MQIRLISALWIVLAVPCRAEVIDRVAVSIGNTAITESELELQLRVSAFLNQEPPKFTEQEERQMANRLIEQKLVYKELQLSRYPVPGEDELKPLLERIRGRYPTEAAFEQALHEYGITLEDLKKQLLWQLTLLRFIEVRFRPGAEVTEQEIRDYFEQTLKPALLKEQPGTTPSLEKYRDKIEQILISRKVDQALEAWLKSARNEAEIQFREEAF